MDLIVPAEIHEETDVSVPSEQHKQILVNRKRPLLRQLAIELVRAQKRIARIRREPPECSPKQFVQGRRELVCPSCES